MVSIWAGMQKIVVVLVGTGEVEVEVVAVAGVGFALVDCGTSWILYFPLGRNRPNRPNRRTLF